MYKKQLDYLSQLLKKYVSFFFTTFYLFNEYLIYFKYTSCNNDSSKK